MGIPPADPRLQGNAADPENMDSPQTTEHDGGADVSVDNDTSKVDERAATITIPSFEREADEARASGDVDEIQSVQDRYHEERTKRAKAQLEREKENE